MSGWAMKLRSLNVSPPAGPARARCRGSFPLALAAFLVLGAGAVLGQEPRALTVDDLFRFQQLSDPRPSPDETQVAYVVEEDRLEDNASHSRIWVVPIRTGPARPLTSPDSSASSPRWSPDGRQLAFLSARGEAETQVWALDTHGGEAVALTDIPQGVTDFAWAPDSRRLVLVLRDPAPERDPDDPAPPWVIDRLQIKRDYEGYLDHRRTHLYVFDTRSGKLRQITSGDYADSSPAWSPDGSTIAFVSNRTEDADANTDTDIWLIDAEVPDATGTPIRVSTSHGADADPAWDPAGSRLTWVCSNRPEIIDYSQTDVCIGGPGRGVQNLTAGLDRMVSAPRFDSGGDRVWFLVEDHGSQQLASVPADGGKIARRVTGERVVREFAPLSDRRAVVLVSEPDLPGNLFVTEAEGPLRPLTHHNDDQVAQLRLARVDKLVATSPDGTPVEAFLYRPPGAEDTFRYPGILWLHGGPMGQYDWGWDLQAQMFAAYGYTVVLPNPRGSTGYGQQFELAIWRDWGGPDLADVLAATDYAVEHGYVDPDRLGVGGWSYGGILTNYVITSTDRFRAAVSGASGALWVANYGHDQYQNWYETELGLPWEDRAIYERLSPFNRVQNITTPTLWIGGENDWNVPILNSEMMYQSMRRLGRDTKLVVYPGQFHGGFPPVYEKDTLLRFLGWFGRLLQNDDSLWPK